MSIPMSKFVVPEFVYGSEARMLAGQFASNIGARKIFIVSDQRVTQQPWFQSIVDEVESEGLEWHLFSDISVNPKDVECEAGAEAYKNSGADLILAVGGGSVMDCAKGIGILSANNGPIEQYEGIDEIQNPIPPLICIPTTAGSGADISQFSIITNTTENYKMAIVSKVIVPDLALVDPDVTLTQDFNLTVDVGLDVLAHAIESYVSNAASIFTRIHSMEAIRLVVESLPQLAEDLQNIQLRDRMMRASLQAGMAFSNASLGLIHAMAHGLGGRFNLIHGELNGILLPAVVEYNRPYAEKEYSEISAVFEQNLGYEAAPADVQLRRFIDEIRVSRGLQAMGVSDADMLLLVPWILNDPCAITNPAPVTAEGVMKVYERVR